MVVYGSIFPILIGDATAVHCDGCSFVILTDQYGDLLHHSLCPVRKFLLIVMLSHSLVEDTMQGGEGTTALCFTTHRSHLQCW